MWVNKFQTLTSNCKIHIDTQFSSLGKFASERRVIKDLKIYFINASYQMTKGIPCQIALTKVPMVMKPPLSWLTCAHTSVSNEMYTFVRLHIQCINN